ncbi:MAG: hypothetical protein LDL39_12760 [Magnetospirillum sp.]|nr:hypothetical protein [Magnetospirillum sp.]
MDSLPDTFHKMIAGAVGIDGIFPHQALILTDAGLQVFALDLSHGQVMRLMMLRARESVSQELIFGLDRSTRPDQGTEFADVLPAAWYRRGLGWKVGVINYRPDPLLVRPWDWDNSFWTAAINAELLQAGAPDLLIGKA